MATTSSSWTRPMLLQPLTQPTRAEYQTWPRIRARSLRSGGWGSPMARVMIPSISTDTCCWHSMAAGSGEARAVNTAPTSWGWRPMARRARSRASMTRSAAVVPLGRLLGQPAVELLDPVDQRRGQQVVLAGEVPVDGAHGHVGPGGHVAHLHRLVAAVEPQRHGGVDDPLAPGLLGSRQGAWHRTVRHE